MKISVIIPVYNVEKYLRQCLDSVINQTYKDLQIICVDDASTDKSLEILQEYAKKDNRIIIVQNEVNLKLGPARNHGMKYATGEYIHFLDSDDWLELDAYEKLVNHLEKAGDVDVLQFLWRNVCMVTGNTEPYKYNINEITEKVINIDNTPDLAVNWRRAAWCKLHRRKFLIDNNIEYNNYPCLEDIEQSIHVLVKAKSVYLVSDIVLNYRTNNSQSLMGKYHKYIDYAVKSYENNIKYCRNLNREARVKILDIELYTLFHLLYGSFIANVLEFDRLKDIVKNMDYEIFKDDFVNYKWFIYYNDIMTNPAWLAKLKYRLRNFTKMYTPFIHDFIVAIRRKIRFLRKI